MQPKHSARPPTMVEIVATTGRAPTPRPWMEHQCQALNMQASVGMPLAPNTLRRILQISIEPAAGPCDCISKAMRRTHEDIQDELLVLQCQAGDRNALKLLITRWQPRLTRLAWRLTGERESSRDAVQEAWLAIVRGLRRLHDPATFRTWAYRIVRNKCADWTRRRVTQRRAANQWQAETSAATDEPAGPSDEIDRLRAAMATLPHEQRTVLTLHYSDELSVVEIARVLDIPAGTVKSRLFHARQRLKEVLERIET